MEYSEYVAAADLGTTKVVIAVARRGEKNKVEIVAIHSLPSHGILKGDVRNSEQASQVIRDVKRKVEDELGITINEVYIGISGQNIRCNKATGYVFVQNSESDVSEVTQRDVQRLRDDMKNTVIPLGNSIISVLPQSYTIDDEADITDPVGIEGKRLEARFNLIVGEDAAIDRIRRTFQKAGLRVAGIILQPLASSEAVLSEDEKELGVAVVDIGGGTTDVCIYYDKIIRHIAVIPMGGDMINHDIKSYGILERHVEKLKLSFGEALEEKAQAEKYINIPSVSGQAPKEISVKALAGIIEARMDDIIDAIYAEIDRCGLKNRLGAGIVLTGGGASLKNLNLLFKKRLGYEVRIASPTMHLTPEGVEKVANPRYSTITGLLLDAVRTGNFTEVEQGVRLPAPEPVQPPVYYSNPNRPLNPQHTQAPALEPIDSEPPYEDDYTDQQYETEEIYTRTKGGGLVGFFKKSYNKLFTEGIDDDEGY